MDGAVSADPVALEAFARDVFSKLGVPDTQAAGAARVLVWANLRGVETHGVRNLAPLYVHMLDEGIVTPDADFSVDHETPFSARVDGGNGLGMAAGVWAMQLAMDKAAASGSGMVAMHNSRHFGAAGYYAHMALAHDMIGISATGRFMPRGGRIGLMPTFAAIPMFSTNPIAFSAPSMEEPPFLLDMATTITPYNRVMLYHELGRLAPVGWGTDDDGVPTTDPTKLNHLYPLGGSRELGSHKGYGLAMVVQILSGVLSGDWAGGSADERAYDGYDQRHDGHFFAAIRVDAFEPVDDFKRGMDVMIRALHDAPKEEGQDRIYIAGEIEHETEQERRRTGIPLPPNVQDDLRKLADRFALPLPY